MSSWFNIFMAGGSGISITAGTPAVVEAAAGVGSVGCAAISSTQVIVFYQIASGWKAMVLDVSGSSITTNTAATVESGSGGNLNTICLTSATQAVVGYGSSKAMVLDISGATITPNTALTITNGIGYTSVVNLDSTRALVSYATGTPSVAARVLTITGSALSQGSEATIDIGTGTGASRNSRISGSQVLTKYDTTIVRVVVLDISGTTITVNTAKNITNALTGVNGAGVAINNSGKATIVYTKSGSSVQSRLLTITGSAISVGSETEIASSGTASNGIIPLNTDQVMGVYFGGSSQGNAIITNSTSPITSGTATQYDAGPVTFQSLCMLSETKGLVFYVDNGNSDFLTACVLTVS